MQYACGTCATPIKAGCYCSDECAHADGPYRRPIAVEEDGDEIITPMPTYCMRCRVGFTHDGKPMYALLFERGGFICCSVCGGSYGPASSQGEGNG
jgi:hypothetical protein